MRRSLALLGAASGATVLVAWAWIGPAPAAAQGGSGCAPPVVAPGGVGEGRNDPNLFPPTVGEVRAAMLFVDFADVRGAPDVRAAYDAFVPEAADWYAEVSSGRLRLSVTPLERRLALSGAVSEYRSAAGGIEAGLRTALQEAVAAADAELDFARYHTVYLVFPFRALGAIGGSGVLILDRPVRVDSAEIRLFTVLFDGEGAQASYFAHETGHVLGLPDLYVSGQPSTFHRWDIMAWPSSMGGLFAWHRWKLGWLEPEEVVCVTQGRRAEATLQPLDRPGGRKAIVVRRGRYAYVAEVRSSWLARAGRHRCKGGVLFYRVEFGAPSGAADIVLLHARQGDFDRVWCGLGVGAPYRLGRGQVARTRAWGFRFEVLASRPDGSFRVRLTALT